MPVYEADCEDCGVYADYLREVKDYLDTPHCPECGIKMRKIIRSAPKGYMVGQFDAFQSTVDRSIIRSQRDLLEHNKRNNVISLADGYSTEQLINHKGIPTEQPRNVKADLAEAYKAVKDGYKPAQKGETLH